MKQYKKHGMTIYIHYKNNQRKKFENITCFNLIDNDLLIWQCYKTRPLVRKMKFVKSFYCEYTKW